jgi:hypothetical protein
MITALFFACLALMFVALVVRHRSSRQRASLYARYRDLDHMRFSEPDSDAVQQLRYCEKSELYADRVFRWARIAGVPLAIAVLFR